MKYLALIAAATLSLAGPVNAGEYLPTTFSGTSCNVLQMGGTLENAYAAAYNDGYLKSLPSGPVMTLNGRTDTWDHHQTLSAMENSAVVYGIRYSGNLRQKRNVTQLLLLRRKPLSFLLKP